MNCSYHQNRVDGIIKKYIVVFVKKKKKKFCKKKFSQDFSIFFFLSSSEVFGARTPAPALSLSTKLSSRGV